MTTATQMTEADVLREAIEFWRKPGSFTINNYFEDHGANGPGPEVGATCAIGGVEQAIWKLTGETVPLTARRAVAKKADGKDRGRATHRVLYAKVMRRVNRLAHKLYPGLLCDEEPVATVEQITFATDDDRLAKRRVLRVFRAALAEVEG